MKWWLLALLLGTCLGVPCGADEPGTVAGEYRFAPGDVIEVTVTPQHKFDRTVTVQPDGRISYPVAGQLQAAGLTIPELVRKLGDGLSRGLVEPSVSVSLKEMSRRAAGRVTLLGAVRSPGAFEIREGMTVAEAVALAGGPTPAGDLKHVTITRPDRSALTLDLSQPEKTGRPERPQVLQPGDVVVVPEGPEPVVLLMGEVLKPGSYEIHGTGRLLEVLTQAGGPTTRADLRRVTIARPGTGARTLDLQPLMVQGDARDPELNALLQPGDTIIVPESAERVYVLGRVTRPDIYTLKPNDRVLDALAKAGGPAADGDLSRAMLVRQEGHGEPVARALDLKKIMAKGEMAENELLRAGDVIYVPDRKNPRSTLDTLVWPLSGLFSLLLH